MADVGLLIADFSLTKTNQPINYSTNQPINQSTNILMADV
jgi:hypothetical protein